MLKPICKTKKRLLRINRKLHQEQMFIIVEEEEEELPTMKIENRCTNISLVYQQHENKIAKEIDICDPRESSAFAWTNPKGEKRLEIEIYDGEYKFSKEITDPHSSPQPRPTNTLLKPLINNAAQDRIVVALDEFTSEKEQIQFYGRNPNVRFGRNKPVYLSVLTNGYTKILRFDNNPPNIQPG